MRLPRFRIRTLMIAVAVAAIESALATVQLNSYLVRHGLNELPRNQWRGFACAFLTINVIFVLPVALVVYLIAYRIGVHFYRIFMPILRFYKECYAAPIRPDRRRVRRGP